MAPLLRESGSSPEYGISLIRQRDVAWKASIDSGSRVLRGAGIPYDGSQVCIKA